MKEKHRTESYRVRGKARSPLERIQDEKWEHLTHAADLLRPLADSDLSRDKAEAIAIELGISSRTVYRYRARLAQTGLVLAIAGSRRGWTAEQPRLSERQESAIAKAIAVIKKRSGPVRVVDLVEEVEVHCRLSGASRPARPSIDRRLKEALGSRVSRRGVADPGNADPPISPGSYAVRRPMEIVQIDHTPMDIVVVDDLYRQPLGKPYLTLATDVATRSILAFVISFIPPNSATVSLCLTIIVTNKQRWLRELGIDGEWPMVGLPKTLHLDNAAEFKSQALLRGCKQYGIEITHRERPHHGGHVERLLGTKMSKLKSLPGATGGSPKARRSRDPDGDSALTLEELEGWFVRQIVGRYHNEPHRGLKGATPNGAWAAHSPPTLPPGPIRTFRIAFLPAVTRTLRRDGIVLHHLRYWHSIFAQWLGRRKKLLLHFDPRDLSRLYVRDGEDYIDVPYFDLRLPSVSLWEVEAAARHIREAGKTSVLPNLLIETIEAQREIVSSAQSKTRRMRRRVSTKPGLSAKIDPLARVQTDDDEEAIDWSKPVRPYPGETW